MTGARQIQRPGRPAAQPPKKRKNKYAKCPHSTVFLARAGLDVNGPATADNCGHTSTARPTLGWSRRASIGFTFGELRLGQFYVKVHRRRLIAIISRPSKAPDLGRQRRFPARHGPMQNAAVAPEKTAIGWIERDLAAQACHGQGAVVRAFPALRDLHAALIADQRDLALFVGAFWTASKRASSRVCEATGPVR